MKTTLIENNVFIYLEGDDMLQDSYNPLRGAKFELGIFSNIEIRDFHTLMERSLNQIVFDANLISGLGRCEHFILLEKGLDIRYLWTSFKGLPKKYKWHENEMDRMYDILILQYTKKGQNILAIGNSFEAAAACWKNQRNAICVEYEQQKYLTAIENFRQSTVQGKLLF